MAIGTAPGVVFGRPYNAGSGVAVTIGEVVDLVRSLTRCRKAVVRDEQRLRPMRSEVRELLADASSLRELTGWRPRVSVKDGLSRSIDWWHDQIKNSRVRREASYAT